MVGRTNADWTDIPADVAAERASIEAEIEGSTLLTAYAQTVAEHPDAVAHQWLGGGEAAGAIVERQYLDKLDSIAGQLPKLRHIVVIDPEGDPGIGDGRGPADGL